MLKLGLIGWPLIYSLSPILHNHWLKENAIEGDYKAWPIEPEKMGSYISQLHSQGTHGCNVTIPHKRAVMYMMNECSEEAKAIEAVNTICFHTDGTRTGHNTDIVGFKNDLIMQMGGDASPKKALLLGAGGAASAAIYALCETFPDMDLVVAARKPQLSDDYSYVPWSELNEVARDADLIINATPLGKIDAAELGLNWTDLKESAFIYDLNYHADETALVHKAREQGNKACDGLGMLVGQAQESFRLWTGVIPIVDKDFLSFVRKETGK